MEGVILRLREWKDWAGDGPLQRPCGRCNDGEHEGLKRDSTAGRERGRGAGTRLEGRAGAVKASPAYPHIASPYFPNTAVPRLGAPSLVTKLSSPRTFHMALCLPRPPPGAPSPLPTHRILRNMSGGRHWFNWDPNLERVGPGVLLAQCSAGPGDPNSYQQLSPQITAYPGLQPLFPLWALVPVQVAWVPHSSSSERPVACAHGPSCLLPGEAPFPHWGVQEGCRNLPSSLGPGYEKARPGARVASWPPSSAGSWPPLGPHLAQTAQNCPPPAAPQRTGPPGGRSGK